MTFHVPVCHDYCVLSLQGLYSWCVIVAHCRRVNMPATLPRITARVDLDTQDLLNKAAAIAGYVEY